MQPRVVPRVVPAGNVKVTVPSANAKLVIPGQGQATPVAVPARAAPRHGTTPNLNLPSVHDHSGVPQAVSQGGTACPARIDYVSSMLSSRGGSITYDQMLQLVPGLTLRELRKMNAEGADLEVTFDGSEWQVRPKGVAAEGGIRERVTRLGGCAPLEELRRDFGVNRTDLREQGYVLYQDKARGGIWVAALPDAAREPGEPLEQEILEKLINIISDAGGALPLGYVNKQCPGLKRVQLEQHFEVNEPKPGHHEVRIPGSTCPPAICMIDGRPSDKSDISLALDEDTLERLAAFILENGGKVFIDHLFLEFPDIKKPQLREWFSVTRRGIKKDEPSSSRPKDLSDLEKRGINLKGRKEVYEVRLKEGSEYPGVGVYDPDDPEIAAKVRQADGEPGLHHSKGKGKGKSKGKSPPDHAKGKGKDKSDFDDGEWQSAPAESGKGWGKGWDMMADMWASMAAASGPYGKGGWGTGGGWEEEETYDSGNAEWSGGPSALGRASSRATYGR